MCNTLKNLGQATTKQLAAWISINAEKPGRIKSGRMENGFLIICYATLSGRYVRAVLDQFGAPIDKKFYHSWDDNSGEPIAAIFPAENETE